MLLGGVFSVVEVEENKSKVGYNFITLIVSGKDAYELFSPEAGGHRIQRVPPTETRGKRHTSTVTVAVIKDDKNDKIELEEKDLIYDIFRAGGNGGQNRNKVETAIRLTHRPTNITVISTRERSQYQNKQNALKELQKRVNELQTNNFNKDVSETIRQQRGSGERGDKLRTYQFTNDVIINHNTGKKMHKIEKFMRGNIEEIQ